MKLAFVILFALVLLAGTLNSCRHYPTPPPGCDTCCDTCKPPCDTCKPCDTCQTPCDTCNIDKDSAAHAFIWTEYTIPGETNLTGVWVFGPNDIMICANSLWHFDGTAFSLLNPIRNGSNPLPMNGALNGFSIFAFTKEEYWLTHGTVSFHTTDGQHFDDIRPGSVNACWGSAPNDVFIVGNGGYIAHWDGTKFTDMVSGTSKSIGKIWGTGHNNVWASGWNQTTGESVLLHYDGTSWSEIDLTKLGSIGPGKHGLIGVWTCDSLGTTVTVACGSFVYRTTNNGSWYSDTLKNGLGGGAFAALTTIRGNSATDFMIQGSGGFLSHWNGKTWFLYDKLYDYTNPSYDINALAFKDNTICMVGFKNGSSYLAVGRRK